MKTKKAHVLIDLQCKEEKLTDKIVFEAMKKAKNARPDIK